MIDIIDYAQLTEFINYTMFSERMIYRIHLREIGIL
jgi:hypothetical protein